MASSLGLRSLLMCGIVVGGAALLSLASVAQDNRGPGVTEPEPTSAIGAANGFFAVINADGSIARHYGVTTIFHSAGTGAYTVHFKRRVDRCAYTATIGLAGSFGTSARGLITVARAAASTKAVYVTTDATAGSPAERGFHLVVTCRPSAD